MTEQFNSHITKLSIVIFILGSLFYAYEFFIQVAPSVMTKELMRDFSANATLLGAMSGCFYYSYTAFQIPAGLLLDRYGARLILTLVTLICAIGAALFAMSHDIVLASIARIFIGSGSAFAFVSALYLIIHWIPIRNLALFIGITQAIGSIGAIGGVSLLSKMVCYVGWRESIWLLAIVGFVLAIIIGIIIRNQPSHIQVVAREQKPKMLESIKVILKNRQTLAVGIYSFSIWAPIVAFAALWGVPYLQLKEHLSPTISAGAISFIWIGVAVGSPLVGWLSDCLKRRTILLTVVAMLGFFSLFVVIYVDGLSYSLLCFLLFMVGMAASGQSLTFAVVKDNNHKNTASAANGFNNMAVVCGGAILQPLIGRLLDFRWNGLMKNGVPFYRISDYHSALVILPICFLIAALISWFAIRETYCMPIYDVICKGENE